MRYVLGLLCVCALVVMPLVGCSETTLGPMLCEGVECDDGNVCTGDACDPATGTCEYVPVADGTACGNGAGTCQQGSCQVACTEQGIRDAIAAGGGPYTFKCAGPQTVVTAAEIVIDTDVILDGEGNLTVDGDDDHVVFYVAEGATVELVGFAVTRGRTDGFPGGGGIFSEGTLTLTNCTVTRCTATANVDPERGNSGGGILNGGSLTVTNSTVSENSADFAGGGINSWGNLTLTKSTVSRNTSSNSGGGIWQMYGTLTLTSSTVSGNTAARAGGIWNKGDPGTITNSTVSGNSGGGLHHVYGELTITNSTISGNTGEGDAIYCADSTLILRNALIDGACTREGDVTWVSNGHNIESPGDSCGFDTNKGDLFDVTAEQLNLGPLQDNGGPTMTHALLTEPAPSVAIDWIPEADCVDADGAPLATDQRGEPRPETGGTMCDVGAFERQPDDQ